MSYLELTPNKEEHGLFELFEINMML